MWKARPPSVAERSRDEYPRALGERDVDFFAQLCAHRHVDAGGDGQHGERHREPGDRGDARAQGHGSRMTYPTPLTV